ncbi:MAG: class III signal peptide-containing protein, partial [Methanobacterium formicicum]|nr:class III signal peptide-containing protein [Methanobacterium formicicum]
MEEKGQASVEYLLLIVVILIILASVTIPLV